MLISHVGASGVIVQCLQGDEVLSPPAALKMFQKMDIKDLCKRLNWPTGSVDPDDKDRATTVLMVRECYV